VCYHVPKYPDFSTTCCRTVTIKYFLVTNPEDGALNSVHTIKIEVQLNSAMRIISGCVKSTQIPWLPTLAHIAPPKLRRKAAAVREFVNCRRHANSLLYEQLLDNPIPRVVSRRPFWTMEEYSMTHNSTFLGPGQTTGRRRCLRTVI
jgi:hypothetical protein